MQKASGIIQVSGIHRDGEIFLDNKKCPFKAEFKETVRGVTMIAITLAVPAKQAGSVLAGLASGADLTLDNVPTLIEQS